MNDRFVELRKSLSSVTDSQGPGGNMNDKLLDCDLESQTVSVLTAKDSILKAHIASIERVAGDMNKVILDQRVATTSKKEYQLATTMTNLVDEGKRELGATKALIDELHAMQCEFGRATSPTEMTICSNILKNASSRFKSALQDYMKANETYKEEMKQKMRRQLKITYPGAKEEEISGLMSDNNAARQAITQKLAGTAPSRSLAVVCNDLQTRYKDLQMLEQAVVELYELFRYLETLATQNQDQLDNIEMTVNLTNCYTEQAQDEIRELKIQRSKYHTKKFLLLVLAIILIVIIIVYVCAR